MLCGFSSLAVEDNAKAKGKSAAESKFHCPLPNMAFDVVLDCWSSHVYLS
jgi:hypothetical protein